MNTIFTHTGIEPLHWLVLFHTRSTPWVERLVPGKFKHISALGHVADAGAWVSYSYECGRTRISLIREGEDFWRWYEAASEDAAVLRFPAPPFEHGPWRWRLGLSCVSAVKHLLGVRGGALWPDGLWRLLLANGAEIVTDGKFAEAQDRHATAVSRRESLARHVGA
jgi:hypothetical protein